MISPCTEIIPQIFFSVCTPFDNNSSFLVGKICKRVVSKRVVLADGPQYQKKERGYIRMSPPPPFLRTPSQPSRPFLVGETPPPLRPFLRFSIKNRPPPLPCRPELPLPLPRAEKNIKYPKPLHQPRGPNDQKNLISLEIFNLDRNF